MDKVKGESFNLLFPHKRLPTHTCAGSQHMHPLTQTQTHVDTYTLVYKHIHTRHTPTFTYTNPHGHIDVYLYIYTYVQFTCTNTYIHTYMNTDTEGRHTDLHSCTHTFLVFLAHDCLPQAPFCLDVLQAGGF